MGETESPISRAAYEIYRPDAAKDNRLAEKDRREFTYRPVVSIGNPFAICRALSSDTRCGFFVDVFGERVSVETPQVWAIRYENSLYSPSLTVQEIRK